MSLRLQLLAAFAYVLLLIIVALEVPLALNLARRIDAEVKNEAAGQAFVVAASASGRMRQPQQLAQVVRTAGNDLGGRVIVVDAPRGRLLADSTVGVTQPLPYATAARPELAHGAPRRPRAGRAAQRHARPGPALHGGAGDEQRPGRRRGPRDAGAWPRSTTGFAARSSR